MATSDEDGDKPSPLVVCGVLRDEVNAVLRDSGWEIPVVGLAPAPCIVQQRFPALLERALRRARRLGATPLVVIGRCHPDLDAILTRHGARRLPIDTCFEALLGDRLRDCLHEANTFFTTPAWLRHWRRALVQGMQWDEITARQNFGFYARVLLLDAGVTPYSDEAVLEFYDYVQVPVEVLPVSLSHLAGLIGKALNQPLPAPHPSP